MCGVIAILWTQNKKVGLFEDIVVKEYILGAFSMNTVVFITHQVELFPTIDIILVLIFK